MKYQSYFNLPRYFCLLYLLVLQWHFHPWTIHKICHLSTKQDTSQLLTFLNDPNPEKPLIVPDKEGFYRVGDMHYDEHQFKLFFGTKEEKELARNAIPDAAKRWTNGVVPYKFNSAVSATNRQKIRSCLDKFNQHFQGCLNVR